MSEIVKIGSLTPRSRGVNLVAKVVEKSPVKTVSSQYDQSEHTLSEALIADDTGAIKLILWDDNAEKVNEGDTIKVNNGFVKVFRGRMQLNLGRYGSIELSDEAIENINTENNLSAKETYSSDYGYQSRGYGQRRPFRRGRL
ncbi:MAG: OB-fold nucleic acid binding domain-containing protein [Aigarchaeota archaeon]|nr:OB-fold nucleic acid binding domain-containing protein [Candidatus Pelearchaeum maunauluense]